MVARLKDGVPIRAAQSELDGIEKATAAADRLSIHLSVIVEPFSEEITGDARKPLWLLLAAMAGVLLMACVNLATLQIVRGVARDHDTALRSALGAGAAQLVQGVLIENLFSLGWRVAWRSRFCVSRREIALSESLLCYPG